MSDNNEQDSTGPRPAGYLRSASVVTFGLRAAALAGLVISAGTMAAGMGGIFDSPDAIATWPTGSTCCITN